MKPFFSKKKKTHNHHHRLFSSWLTSSVPFAAQAPQRIVPAYLQQQCKLLNGTPVNQPCQIAVLEVRSLKTTLLHLVKFTQPSKGKKKILKGPYKWNLPQIYIRKPTRRPPISDSVTSMFFQLRSSFQRKQRRLLFQIFPVSNVKCPLI